MGGETRPTLWVPDHAASQCMGCHTQFWFGRRKHHCRSCGLLFCSECSEQAVPIPTEQLYQPVKFQSGFVIGATLICLDCLFLQEESKPMWKLQRTLKKQQKRKRWTLRSRKERMKKPRMT